MTWTIHEGDALTILRTLPDAHVQCVVTSPPYWGLRDYGMAGQLGLEPTPEANVAKMVEVFREVRRVLRDDGTLWLNMGDGYASDQKGSGGHNAFAGAKRTEGMFFESRKMNHGLKPKDLIGMPWRLAFALQADGWWLRSDIIWAKPNPMPESVTDRPTKAHEYVFLLTKSERYYYDADAVREVTGREASWDGWKEKRLVAAATSGNLVEGKAAWKCPSFIHPAGRNLRTVWTIPTEPFPEAHFATFPRRLVLPCILAGTSAKGCCAHCGASWERIVEAAGGTLGMDMQRSAESGRSRTSDSGFRKLQTTYQRNTIGWRPTCRCAQLYDPERQPCRVLDPFCGSGTVGVVARHLGRDFIGIELKPEEMARRRIQHPELDPVDEVAEGQLGLFEF